MSNGHIFREIKEALKDDPNSITPAALNRLVLEGMIGLKEQMDKMDTVPKETLEQVEKHETVLFGDGKKDPGLIQDVKEIKKFMADIKKIMWIVVTPILAAISLGILALISLAPYLERLLGQ